ncbi:sigma factor-like helix-turn-helix DNA-binding protein [Roseateles sp. P5_D6]
MAKPTERLPESERRVIVRHYFQQLPFDEIARGLGLTKGRISKLHHAGLRRLRDHIRELNSGDFWADERAFSTATPS